MTLKMSNILIGALFSLFYGMLRLRKWNTSELIYLQEFANCIKSDSCLVLIEFWL